jgi:translation initiation factor IF-1
MALVPRRHRQQMAGLKAGDRVVLGLSPFDLSKGIIQSIVNQAS